MSEPVDIVGMLSGTYGREVLRYRLRTGDIGISKSHSVIL